MINFSDYRNNNTYLTEQKLAKFLSERIDPNIIHNQPINNTRTKPDFRSEKFKIIIQFDGFRHYSDPKQILKDMQDNTLFLSLNYQIIRIPYFIQLDELIIYKLFGNYTNNIASLSNFPHGFVSNKALLPANFCELGLARFLHELEFYSEIKETIINSLAIFALEKKEWALIIPPSIKYLFDNNFILSTNMPITETISELFRYHYFHDKTKVETHH